MSSLFSIQFQSLFNVIFTLFLPLREVSLLPYLQDGTRETLERSLTTVRDLGDVCYHSYFSCMDDLRLKGPPDVDYCDIRFSPFCYTSASCFVHVAAVKLHTSEENILLGTSTS